MKHFAVILNLVCLNLVCAIFAPGLSEGHAEEPRDQVRLLDMHANTYVTPLVNWTAEKWEIEKPDPQEIPFNEVVAVDWFERTSLSVHRQPLVMLVNGDLLAFTIAGWNEESVTGNLAGLADQTLSIPLEFVRGAILHPLADLRELAAEMQQIRRHPAGNDLVSLANGDQVRGQMVRLEKETFMFERDSASLPLPRAQVYSIALNPELSVAGDQESDSRILSLTLLDGSRLTLNGWEKTEAGIRGNLIGKVMVEIPLKEIAGLRARSEKFVRLSEIPPSSFRYTPFLTASRFTLQTNANGLGGPLTLGGRNFPCGIGMRSRSEAVYELNGEYSGFMTTLGIDDVTDRRGAAACRILLDGKPLFETRELRGDHAPIQTPLLPIKSGKQLTISVDFGEEGDVLDLVDVCDPILLK